MGEVLHGEWILEALYDEYNWRFSFLIYEKKKISFINKYTNICSSHYPHEPSRRFTFREQLPEEQSKHSIKFYDDSYSGRKSVDRLVEIFFEAAWHQIVDWPRKCSTTEQGGLIRCEQEGFIFNHTKFFYFVFFSK